MRPARILVFGNAPTLGDLGIGQAMLEEIRRVLPSCELVVVTDEPDLYRRLPVLQENAEILPVANLMPGAHMVAEPSVLKRRLKASLGYVHDVRALSGGRDPVTAQAPDVRPILDAFAWADVTVHQGGPVWNDRWIRSGILRGRLLEVLGAKGRQSPTMLFAQSFGPFEWPGMAGRQLRLLTRSVLQKMDLITVRDRFSIPSLRKIGVDRPRLVQAADVAWCLGKGGEAEALAALAKVGVTSFEPGQQVGLTLRMLPPRYGFDAATVDRFTREAAQFLDGLAERFERLVFLSTEYREDSEIGNDLDAIAGVQSHMKAPERVVVIRDELLPHELQAAYAKLGALVTMRLHPGIFAMGAGVPTFVIGYDPKCSDLVQQTGTEQWFRPVDRFRAEDALRGVDDMARDLAQAQQVFTHAAEERRADARKSAEALVDLIRRTAPAADVGAPAEGVLG